MLPRIKKSIITILDKHFGNDYLLFLFGSFAKNKVDLSSDIDSVVYSREALAPLVFAQAKDELEKKTPTLRSIDLINLNRKAIDRQLLANILKEWVLWKKGKNCAELLKNLKKHLKNLKK